MERRFEQSRLNFRRISICVAFLLLFLLGVTYFSLGDFKLSDSETTATVLTKKPKSPNSRESALHVERQSFDDLGTDKFKRRRSVAETIQNRSNASKFIHVISHFHWDREWYQSHEKFRRVLVHILDDIFRLFRTDLNFTHFHADGQMVVVEDYLEIRPEMLGEMKEAGRKNLISLGPWYTQPDVFLVSGEALVRNLLLGISMAKQFGQPSLVGYLPDSFGHCSQIPQIYKGFGINATVIGRGYRVQGSELYWSSPDGSTIFLLFLPNWYCNGLLNRNFEKLKYDKKGERVFVRNWFFDKHTESARASTINHTLLLNGCDHSSVDYDIGDIISVGNNEFEAKVNNTYSVIHSNFREYLAVAEHDYKHVLDKLDAAEEESREAQFGQSAFTIARGNSAFSNQMNRMMNAGEVLVGELHEGVDVDENLVNIYSAMMRQKQDNWRLQVGLSLYAEPFHTMLWESMKGDEGTMTAHRQDKSFYDAELLSYAWRQLLQNHAHDSIGGCSVEEVHRDVDGRFARGKQTADLIFGQAVTKILDRIDLSPFNKFNIFSQRLFFTVFNALPILREKELITVKLQLRLPACSDVDNILVADNHGVTCPSHIVSKIAKNASSPTGVRILILRLAVVVTVNGLGYRTYYVGIRPRHICGRNANANDDSNSKRDAKVMEEMREREVAAKLVARSEDEQIAMNEQSKVNANEDTGEKRVKRMFTPDDDKYAQMAKKASMEEKKNLERWKLKAQNDTKSAGKLPSIANSFMTVYFNESSGDLLMVDHLNNFYSAMNRFEFCDEGGDLYHSLPQSCTRFDEFKYVRSSANALYQTLEYEVHIAANRMTPYSGPVEKGLKRSESEEERFYHGSMFKKNSPNNTFVLYVHLLLPVQSNKLQIRVTLNNVYQNFRVRAMFKGQNSFRRVVDTPFDYTKYDSHEFGGSYHAQQKFFATYLHGTGKGFLVASRGLPEYQFYVERHEDYYHALALFRSTTELRDWGSWKTSTGTLQGFHIFEYAVVLFNNVDTDSFASSAMSGEDDDVDADRARKRSEARAGNGRRDGISEDDRVMYAAAEQAHKFNTPMVAHQVFVKTPISNDMMGLERTDLHYFFEEAEHDGTASALPVEANEVHDLNVFDTVKGQRTLANSHQYLTISPSSVVFLTAFKKSERSEHLILRLYNPTSVPTLAAVTFNIKKRVKLAYYTNMNEDRIRKSKPLTLSRKGNLDVLEVYVTAKKVITLQLVVEE